MANPKANVSFVLLFTFLFSPHVLTHKLHEVQNQIWSVGGIPPDYDEAYLDFIGTRPSDKKDNNDKAYYHYSGFQPVDPPDAAIHPMEIMDNGKKHYYHHNDFQVAEVSEIRPSDMKNNEPKKHKDGIMRHRKMMRPSEIDDLRFKVFPCISCPFLGLH